MQLEAVGHGDNGAADGGVIAVFGDVMDERLVDLDPVDGESFQVTEGRIAGAEIVDRDLKSLSRQLVQQTFHQPGVFHQGGFGDFQLYMLGMGAGHIDDTTQTRGELILF